MLDLSRYLLGVADIAMLAAFAMLGAVAVRARLLPGFAGAPAHLATIVLSLAVLTCVAELLGTVALFTPLAYLLAVVLVGGAAASLVRRPVRGEARGRLGPVEPSRPASAPAAAGDRPGGGSPPGQWGGTVAVLAALALALIALIKFSTGSVDSLRTGMTGFDTTWYHGTFAAGFFQSGDTWSLHFIAPQFLAWFYPANAEVIHAVGMLAFGRDILSPLLNLGWFAACLLALWCIGRPFGVAPATLVLGAIALSLPAFADQSGEARNDIVGAFFLLAGVAIALNARFRVEEPRDDGPTGGEPTRAGARAPTEAAGALVVAGLAAGLAAGTKLNFAPPAVVLIVGLSLGAPPGGRWRALAMTSAAALVGGGYWYLRNLIHTGNPLPWIDRVGPISLPGPVQPLGGREGHSVLGYLTDGSVWSRWLLPGLHDGLTALWPLLLALVACSLVLCLGRRTTLALRVAGAVGLAIALAWLVAPTSASGPNGAPHGFESGLRYLVPALALGLGLLPAALSVRFRRPGARILPNGRMPKALHQMAQRLSGGETPRPRPAALALAAAIGVGLVAVGYPVQRHYLANRYADPAFAAPGLNAAFGWARSASNARIGTTTTRQYPLFGTDLTNDVRFVGAEQPHGGFTAPTGCAQWRRLLNAGRFDYVVASRDRIESGKPPYPPEARWTEGPNANVVLRKPPTVVFRLSGTLPLSGCRR